MEGERGEETDASSSSCSMPPSSSPMGGGRLGAVLAVEARRLDEESNGEGEELEVEAKGTAAVERGEGNNGFGVGKLRREGRSSEPPPSPPKAGSVSSLLGPPLRSAPRGRRGHEAPVDGDLHEDDCEGE
ncbi:hypothetical protein [Oryza sativa Japonica Group]|uniref:Uncharacterized protein n=1 Tax=Oryza sativa subsp. japonica TaxID=39947 RepID=Q5JL46_ORYSJ|nr:hypothetical protein [Oryza sativa Japonica Group]